MVIPLLANQDLTPMLAPSQINRRMDYLGMCIPTSFLIEMFTLPK